jgi:cysteine-rich repeat protein
LIEECGNNRIDFDEECDDGNLDSDDGCSSTCIVEFCGDGIPNASNALASVEFRWVGTSCGGPANIVIDVNGTNVVNRQDTSGYCSCFPGIQSELITDPVRLALFQSANSSVRFRLQDGGGNMQTAWMLMRRTLVGASTPTDTVLFDLGGGGNALGQNSNLCSMGRGFDVDDTTPFSQLFSIEECDDGNPINGDGCETDCTVTVP